MFIPDPVGGKEGPYVIGGQDVNGNSAFLKVRLKFSYHLLSRKLGLANHDEGWHLKSDETFCSYQRCTDRF